MGVQGFLRDVVVLLGDRRGKGVAGCHGPWNETMEPDWFAMPTPPRTSRFSCSRLSLLCSRTCAASALLPHQWLPACMRVVGCLAYARACGNELSRPSVLHRAVPASTSAWVKGARRAWLHRGSSELVTPDRRLRSATSPSDLPRHKRFSASARAMVCSHLATSKSSMNSSQCRTPQRPSTSSTCGSTAPWAGPPRIVALQHLPHRMRPSCTPIRSLRRHPAHRRSA
jgi:hypothetical protein